MINKVDLTQIPIITHAYSVKEELPSEIWRQIFQFLTEKEGRNIMLTSKQFRYLELSCSPYLNIMNIAFNLRCQGLTEFDTPSLIQNEEFSPFTCKEISRITRLNKQNNSLSYLFLANNKSLSLKLVNQIMNCTKWNLNELETFLPTHPLTKLCNLILTKYTDEKEEINKSEFLATALSNITFERQLIWERLKEKYTLYDYTKFDYTSKIDVLIMIFAIKKKPEAYTFVAHELKNDPDILKAAGRESYCSIL